MLGCFMSKFGAFVTHNWILCTIYLVTALISGIVTFFYIKHDGGSVKCCIAWTIPMALLGPIGLVIYGYMVYTNGSSGGSHDYSDYSSSDDEPKTEEIKGRVEYSITSGYRIEDESGRTIEIGVHKISDTEYESTDGTKYTIKD